MTGIISVEVEFYLDMDADKEEAEQAVSSFQEQVEEMGLDAVHIQAVKVKDTTTHQ